MPFGKNRETFLKKFSPHLPLVTRVPFLRKFLKTLFLLLPTGHVDSILAEISQSFFSVHFTTEEMKSVFSMLPKNVFLTIRTFTYGFVRVFSKTFFKKGVSHYTQKNIAFWGGLSEKTSKNFIPPVIRRIEGLIGGVF